MNTRFNNIIAFRAKHPWMLSAILHIVIFSVALLLYGSNATKRHASYASQHKATQKSAQSAPVPIHAVAVDAQQVATEMRHIVQHRQHIKAQQRQLQQLKQHLAVMQKKQVDASEQLVTLKRKQQLAAKAAQQKKLLMAKQLAKALGQQSMVDSLADEEKDFSKTSHGGLKQDQIMARYRKLIVQTIAQHWRVPSTFADAAHKNIACRLLVQLDQNGKVKSVRLLKSSGYIALDHSARAAVMDASPLPVPHDPELGKRFRSLRLTVRPSDVS